MDGVLSGWDEHLNARADEVPELDDFPRYPERGWNDYNLLPKAHKRLVFKILEDPDFYVDLPAIPGAIDAVKEVKADGHDVSFVTTPWDSNPMGHQGKVMWIRKHLGMEFVKGMVILRDKTRWVGDVLIDDKPAVKGIITPLWSRIVYDQPYNQESLGPRIMNWTDGTWKSVLYGHAEEMQGVRAYDLAP